MGTPRLLIYVQMDTRAGPSVGPLRLKLLRTLNVCVGLGVDVLLFPLNEYLGVESLSHIGGECLAS